MKLMKIVSLRKKEGVRKATLPVGLSSSEPGEKACYSRSCVLVYMCMHTCLSVCRCLPLCVCLCLSLCGA